MIQMHFYWIAYVCFVVAGVWSILWWQCSDWVFKQSVKRVKTRGRIQPDVPLTLQRYLRERNKLWVMRAGGILVGCVAIITVVGYVRSLQINYELDLLYGRLYPASDADYGPCPVVKGSVNLHIGPDEFQVSERNLPIDLVEVDSRSVLTLDKGSDGSLVVIADVRDPSNKLIVRLSRDEFRVNPNNYFELKHPGRSRSEIEVLDQEGTTALDARYANGHTFSVTGKLYAYGAPINLSSENGVQVGIGTGVKRICISAPNLTSDTLLNFTKSN